MKNAAAFQAHTANFKTEKFRSVAGNRKTDGLGKLVLRAAKERRDRLQAASGIVTGDNSERIGLL